MIRFILNCFENFIDSFLKKNVGIMPLKLTKLIAFYYTNAVVRKLYLNKLGFILGEGSYSNLGLSFDMNDDLSPCVFVKENVSIGPNVTFIPNSEPNNSQCLKDNKYVKEHLIKRNATIVVEKEAWLGANCVILPGVTIKEGCIIGAGAVVTKDTSPYSIYAGVPAKKIRELNND